MKQKRLLFLNSILNEGCFKSVEVIEIDDIIRINQFYIQISLRNRGVGSKELKTIISYADRVKKVIYLRSTSSKNRRFYRRHGFVANDGAPFDTNMKYVPSSTMEVKK